MSWVTEFLTKSAGPASLTGAPVSPGKGGAGGITPPLNPVQQIQQQRLAAGATNAAPEANPDITQAQNDTAAAQQEAAAAKAQAQQQVAMETMRAQQDAQQQVQQAQAKSRAEVEKMKADLDKSRMEAEKAKIEMEKHKAMGEVAAAKPEHASPRLTSALKRVQKAESGIKSLHPAMTLAPAALPKVASSIQQMQTGGYGKPGIMTMPTFRPTFGKLLDPIVDKALPMIYGMPDWSLFFGRRAAPAVPMPFDPMMFAGAMAPQMGNQFAGAMGV